MPTLLTKITSDNYADAAARTECTYDGFVQRATAPGVLNRLKTAMQVSIMLADDNGPVDVLKKHIAYGKAMPAGFITDHDMLAQQGLPFDLTHRLLDPEVQRLLHVGLGLQTEASEYLKVLYAHVFDGKPLDKVHLAEEVGDSLWYTGVFAAVMGWKFSKLLTQNIQKLFDRFPAKFTEMLAIHRDTNKERKTLARFHR